MPQSQKDYISTWKRLMPDWEFILWNEDNFDVNICEYSREAYALHKWAFVSDVARLKALLEIGGIYLDTDVELFGSLDRFRVHKAFSAIEIYQEEFERLSRKDLDEDDRPIIPGTSISCCGYLSAVLGAESNHPLIKECYEHYLVRPAYKAIGDFNSIVIDGLLADASLRYGFRFRNIHQDLGVVTLYPNNIFSYIGVPMMSECVAYHHNTYSWMPMSFKKRFFLWLDKLCILKPYRSIKRFILSNIKKLVRNKQY